MLQRGIKCLCRVFPRMQCGLMCCPPSRMGLCKSEIQRCNPLLRDDLFYHLFHKFRRVNRAVKLRWVFQLCANPPACSQHRTPSCGLLIFCTLPLIACSFRVCCVRQNAAPNSVSIDHWGYVLLPVPCGEVIQLI